MNILILGLLVFLTVHSLRMFAEEWRKQVRQRMGPGPFKGVYSLLSLLGFALIVWGYGQARLQPTVLWAVPAWTRHLAALLMLVSMVLLVASGVPGNGIKARLRHPMVLTVKVWALAHLLANNTLADLLLFGTFLFWAALNFRAARGRDRAEGITYAPGTTNKTVLTVVLGCAVWALFAFWGHQALIGVRPFG
jgi:uncharacterized membrane protein